MHPSSVDVIIRRRSDFLYCFGVSFYPKIHLSVNGESSNKFNFSYDKGCFDNSNLTLPFLVTNSGHLSLSGS